MKPPINIYTLITNFIHDNNLELNVTDLLYIYEVSNFQKYHIKHNKNITNRLKRMGYVKQSGVFLGVIQCTKKAYHITTKFKLYMENNSDYDTSLNNTISN